MTALAPRSCLSRRISVSSRSPDPARADRNISLVLFQYHNDLLFAVQVLLHLRPPVQITTEI